MYLFGESYHLLKSCEELGNADMEAEAVGSHLDVPISCSSKRNLEGSSAWAALAAAKIGAPCWSSTASHGPATHCHSQTLSDY